MTLKGDGLDGHKPGQFVNLKIDGCFLRRPISVYDAGKDFVTILYKIVGKGTKLLAAAVPGSRLDVLTHLGNGFDPGVRCKRPLDRRRNRLPSPVFAGKGITGLRKNPGGSAGLQRTV